MIIVVGYVPTPQGRAALTAAAQEAAQRDDDLIVVTGVREDVEDDAATRAEQVKAAHGLREVRVLETPGGLDAAEALLAAAEEHQARLIVIGLRRRSPVGKLILGSNAQRVLLDAACPVLAVKAPSKPG